MVAWEQISCWVHIFGKGENSVYQYTLSRERINKTKDWGHDELDPNISPGVALRLARRKFELLQPFGDSDYRFELQLQQYWGKWLWAV